MSIGVLSPNHAHSYTKKRDAKRSNARFSMLSLLQTTKLSAIRNVTITRNTDEKDKSQPVHVSHGPECNVGTQEKAERG